MPYLWIILMALSAFAVTTGIFALYIFAKVFQRSELNLPIGILFFVVFWRTVLQVFEIGWYIHLVRLQVVVPDQILVCRILGVVVLWITTICLLSMVCYRFDPKYDMRTYKCESIPEAFAKSIVSLRYLPQLFASLNERV